MLDDTKYYNNNQDFINFYERSRFSFSPGLANGDEIEEFIEAGFLENINIKDVNATSIDLNINDDDLWKFETPQLVDLTMKETPSLVKMKKSDEGKYYIFPNMFFLASTQGVCNFPNWLSAIVELRSSTGRIAINHMKAGWIDPGFSSANITLEFKNESPHTYLISSNCCFIQLCFHKSYPVSKKYDYRTKGSYNGVYGTVASKGV